jgi:hypothetical protein
VHTDSTRTGIFFPPLLSVGSLTTHNVRTGDEGDEIAGESSGFVVDNPSEFLVYGILNRHDRRRS